MIIKHEIGNLNIETENNNPLFLLRQNKGDFALFSSLYNTTKYNGYFTLIKENNSWEMLKSIHEINIKNLNNLSSIKKTKKGFIKIYENKKEDIIEKNLIDENIIEEFKLNNILEYEIKNFKGEIEIILDPRWIHDYSSEGRTFNIYKKDNLLIIEYTKYSDNSLNNEQYKVFTVIKGINHFEEEKKWFEKKFEYDEKRNSKPYSLYVFNAINIFVENNLKLKIATDINLDNAINKILNNSYNNKETNNNNNNKETNNNNNKETNNNNKETNNIINNKLNNQIINYNLSQEDYLTYLYSCLSIENSIVETNRTGIYAGLPWFYQFWTRDEAISLKSCYLINKKNEVKNILLNLIKNISSDGRIPNRIPSSILGSADGVGWVFKRISEMLDLFEKEEIEFIKQKLIESIYNIELNYMNDNLIKNKAKETWMDTEHLGDTRDGFRIEIQTLHLNMLNLAHLLTRNKYYLEKEITMKKKIKDIFLKNNILADGKNDLTIRPNIFIAYYVYPNLLEKEEWIKVFNLSIEKLWLEWGGFSTIDKSSYLFCENYTGENNLSYHRGDSWFFINNIAAICLHRLNKNKYQNLIKKIINANTKDCLYLEIIGETSEISSASKQKAQGSLAQSWSSATFIELINELIE
jgi:glycogen debranching enzyme